MCMGTCVSYIDMIMVKYLQDIQSWQAFFLELTHIEVSDVVDFEDCYEAREASITAYMKDHPLSWRDITKAVYKCGEEAALNSSFQMVSDEGKIMVLIKQV